MKKKINIKLVMIVAALVFTACQSKEEKYISLQKECIEIMEDISYGSKYDAPQKVEKLRKVYSECLETGEGCDFSDKQQDEVEDNNKKIAELSAKVAEKLGRGFNF